MIDELAHKGAAVSVSSAFVNVIILEFQVISSEWERVRETERERERPRLTGFHRQ